MYGIKSHRIKSETIIMIKINKSMVVRTNAMHHTHGGMAYKQHRRKQIKLFCKYNYPEDF